VDADSDKVGGEASDTDSDDEPAKIIPWPPGKLRLATPATKVKLICVWNATKGRFGVDMTVQYTVMINEP
jgi:hypothetical protein